MSRTPLLALLCSLAATAAVACGGKVVFDEPTSNATSTSGAASSGGTTTGGTGSSSSGAGTCDPAQHTLDVTSFDTSCVSAADCIAVYAGDLCSQCTCPNAAIDVGEQGAYEAERQAKAPATKPPGGCFCPKTTVACPAGHCAIAP